MQFYFIRHGQSENNLLYVQTGSWKGRNADPDLTPLGRQQAQKLAHFLQGPKGSTVELPEYYAPQNLGGFALTHLYCSLMIRAIETGVVVARALDLPLVAWEDAHEVGGIHSRNEKSDKRIGLEGKNRAFFQAHYPDLVLPTSLGERGWWNRPFEDYDRRSLRARRFLDDLIERHGGTDDRVAVVSHGGFYNHLVRAILGLQGESACWFSLNNVAITRIDFDDGEIWLQYMNRVGYMPREMIS